MRARVRALILVALAIDVSSAAAQGLTERQHVVLAAMDADADDRIDADELRVFLIAAIEEKGRRDGLVVRPADNVSALNGLVKSILDASTSDGDDTIAPAEIAAMEAVSLSPFFQADDTVAALLPKGPTDAQKRGRKPWPDALERWIDIRQSFLDEQSIGKPAKLSLTNHSTDDETVEEGKARRFYTFKVSAILDGPLEWEFWSGAFVRPVLGYELNIDSSAPAKDLIVHRVGVASDVLAASTRLFRSHTFRTTFDVSTDRDYVATVLGATLEYTPNAPRIGIGRFLGGGKAVDFRWRPYLGAIWSDVRNPGSVDAYKGLTNFRHDFLRLTGELRFGDRWKVTPEATFWHGDRVDPDTQEVDASHALHTLSNRWILSQSNGAERVSLDLSFSLGRASPDFQKQEQFEVALAFKF